MQLQLTNAQWAAWHKAMEVVMVERHRALEKHGALRRGPLRWIRLLAEEWQEINDELSTMAFGDKSLPAYADARNRAKIELAQLAQLCIGVIELIQQEEEICRKAR